MKRTLLVFLFSFCIITLLNAATLTASQSGNWSDASTWGGVAPTGSTDVVTIGAGITVTLTADAQASNITINGTLNDNGFTLTLARSNNTGAVITTGSGGTHVSTGSGSITLSGTGTIKISSSTGTVLTLGNLTINPTATGSTNICYISGGSIVVTGTLTLSSSSPFSLGGKILTLYKPVTNASSFATTSITLTGAGSGTSVVATGTLILKGNNSAIIPSSLLSTTSPITSLTVDVGAGNTYTLPGNLTLSAGKLIITSGTLSTGTNTLSVGAASSQIAPNAVLSVPSGGTANFNGLSLTIQSDATGSGSIAAVGGTLSGVSAVTVQKYIPAKRAFRFIGHPFNASLALSGLTGLDITGTGGSTNGFVTTTTNNPSAFWYDPTAGNSGTNPDPGWTAFTSTNGAGANAWGQYKGINILVRGTAGQGTDGNAYTPSATTIAATGSLNIGNQTVTATLGTNSGYNLISNPYPSSIDLQKLTLGSGISPNYYLWDLSLGTRGGYTTVAYNASSTYVIPMATALFVRATSASNNTVGFTEAAKTTASLTNSNLAGMLNSVSLQLSSANTTWDNLQINFEDNATAGVDRKDAVKLMNPEVSLYSLTNNGTKLAIDYRPAANVTVPIGISGLPSTVTDYTFTVSKAGVNSDLFLHDQLTDSWTKIENGASYTFSSSEVAINNRFEVTAAKVASLSAATADGTYTANVYTTPSKIIVKYNAPNAVTTSVRIAGLNGNIIDSKNAGTQTSGTVEFAAGSLAQGLYVVEVMLGNQVITQKSLNNF